MLILCILAYGLGGGLAVAARARVGELAPDFASSRFGGGDLRLSELRGQIVVLNFWASWCDPCRAEAPVLEQASRNWRDRGVTVVGVDTSDSEIGAGAFLLEFSISYPNIRDHDGEVARDYGVSALPQTFFVDSEGRIAIQHIGPPTRPQLDKYLDDLIR